MNRQQLQTRVLEAIERVRGGVVTEDTAIEFKSQLPPAALSVARQIAGMANAAHGDDIIWVFGVDESERTVISWGSLDWEKWWPGVRKHFCEDEAPDMYIHTTVADEVTGLSVAPLAFRTDNAPYVVNVPSEKGISAQWEVPWRVATGTQSARRSNLLRMLTPRMSEPHVSIEAARIRVASAPTQGGIPLDVAIEFFVDPRGNHLTLPHRWSWAEFVLGDGETLYRDGKFSHTPGSAGSAARIDGVGNALFDAPGTIVFEGTGPTRIGADPGQLLGLNGSIRLVLTRSDGTRIRTEAKVGAGKTAERNLAMWELARRLPWER